MTASVGCRCCCTVLSPPSLSPFTATPPRAWRKRRDVISPKLEPATSRPQEREAERARHAVFKEGAALMQTLAEQNERMGQLAPLLQAAREAETECWVREGWERGAGVGLCRSACSVGRGGWSGACGAGWWRNPCCLFLLSTALAVPLLCIRAMPRAFVLCPCPCPPILCRSAAWPRRRPSWRSRRRRWMCCSRWLRRPRGGWRKTGWTR